MLAKASAHLEAVRFKVKTKGYIIEAVDSRDYSTAWRIIFPLMGSMPFLVYRFTGPQNRITFNANTPGRLTITYREKPPRSRKIGRHAQEARE